MGSFSGVRTVITGGDVFIDSDPAEKLLASEAKVTIVGDFCYGNK